MRFFQQSMIVFVLVLLGIAAWVYFGGREPVDPGAQGRSGSLAQVPPVKILPFERVVTPTARERLDPSSPDAFQPTASGKPESALFGSVRTVSIGSHLYSSFHEGIDIAPLHRNVRGLPLDEVRAVAAGSVGYINRHPGNSNYGIYVVVMHDDPLGRVYTLYAHLAKVPAELRPGQAVEAGTILGTLGNTPAATIPLARAHLHFEVGVIGNGRFDRWFREQRQTPDHGLYNGLNLFACDPLVFFRVMESGGNAFQALLAEIPPAFELMIPAGKPLDYFRQYPGLWNGEPFSGAWMVIKASENGALLAGRMATPEEIRQAVSRKPVVLKVDAKVLGRNGCRLVVNDKGRWRLGEKGARWLEILEY
jgi:murein DD-endopeptidase MepM/ murein hydrolase activator NlpD